MDALFIKELRIIKYLLILITTITLLISGCIDLDESYRSANSKFYGTWEYTCDSGLGGILTVSAATIIHNNINYENEDCTGNVVFEYQEVWQVHYNHDVITPSGMIATVIEVAIVLDTSSRYYPSLIYRSGKQLYLGNDEGEGMRITDLNFDQYYTLK